MAPLWILPTHRKSNLRNLIWQDGRSFSRSHDTPAELCRFCQYSFVEEEAKEQARLEAEQALRETEKAARRARQQAEYESQQAIEAAKPWLRRKSRDYSVTNGTLLGAGFLTIIAFSGFIWYSVTHPTPYSTSQSTMSSSENPSIPPPDWVTQERSKVPKSVWDKKVGWATQHHCYFMAMSKDEIVQALGKPTDETSYDLTYKKQTNECAHYDGDVCAEYETEQRTIFLKDGYEDKQFNDEDGNCHTLYGEHQYLGLEIPNFKLSKVSAQKGK